MDDDLLRRYVSGEATDEERARLRAALQNDPALADALFEAAEMERDLGEVLRVAAKPRRRRWPLVAAAAALLAAASAWFLWSGGDLPRVELVEGAVSPALSAGARLDAGQDVDTNRGRLVLRYDDGTRLDLGARTALRDLGSDKTMTLLRGTLSADVTRQREGKSMIIRTPQAEAIVVGTRFTMAVRPESTRLEVSEGRVLLVRLSDRKSAEVVSGHFAVAAPGAAPVVLAFAPKSWLSVPGTAMAQVAADAKQFPRIQGTSGPAAVIGAWSGAAFDTRRNRLVVWGGGYSDYFGNELYAFSADTLAWERVTAPNPDPRLSQETNADGSPNARATYNGLAYLSDADRFFAYAGSVAGNGFGVCRTPWTFDFESKTWAPGVPGPSSELGGVCAADPQTRKIWWGDGKGLFSFDRDAATWTKHNEDPFYYQTGAFDAKRGRWILVGAGQVFSYDLRSPRPTRVAWTTTGADSLVAAANPGVDYDPVRDRIVAWAGGPVCTLDPGTKIWTLTNAPGAPTKTTNGIFGRWRYVPGLDAFILVTAIDQNVHFYKP
jgi:ferric-dicitrate binding protein FerR (iron transport regulator)